MGKIEKSSVANRRPLLADRVAVVPGNPDIRAVGCDRIGKPQQRRAVAGRFWGLRIGTAGGRHQPIVGAAHTTAPDP